MNIFVLDEDPKIAAQMQCNSHCIKMILESFQMLSTAHRILDDVSEDSVLYKATHKNHPCSIWARETSSNYNWLYEHTKALSEEYTFRYGKIHKSWEKLGGILKHPPKNIPEGALTKFSMAMPEEFQDQTDVVGSYQRYYQYKQSVMKMEWAKREIPKFFQKKSI